MDGGKVVGTNKNIGHNVTAHYPAAAASYIGLENPELFTGHSLRRTSATVMADAGLSLMQIKCTTGHRSDTVVQGFNYFF
jgi:integrase